jgi:hypothetical protein
MSTGVYTATNKKGDIYYRANIHYRGKHISLGSYPTRDAAGEVYDEARDLLEGNVGLADIFATYSHLPFDKAVILLNFRDKGFYLGTPIYMLSPNYFVYYLSPDVELKFDNDDLFYYSSHRIIRRGGHLYVNDYGMQSNILSRYGIRNYAVANVDYEFVNGDPHDFRYQNIRIINPWYGVSRQDNNGRISYLTRIHINGNYQIGIFNDDVDAAIAYNKAVDLAKTAGINRNYPTNYITSLSAREYADRYTKIRISRAYREYLSQLKIN